MKAAKTIIGTVLILLAICCAVILSAKRVPKEEVTTTAPTTAESTTTTATTTTTEPTIESTTVLHTTTKPTTTERLLVFDDNEYICPEYFRTMGVISDGQHTYTWYSENVLPGRGLNIPGRHSDGYYVLDEDDYIVLASGRLPKGTVIETPFGPGKVYDVCETPGVIDVYTSF